MNPVLYILMRTDLPSLNPGKAMAQAAHAANAFTDELDRHVKSFFAGGVNHYFQPEDINKKKNPIAQYMGYEAWKGQTGSGFGTTIVLDGKNLKFMSNIVDNTTEAGFFSQLILDPTYPIRDGDATHIVNCITCGYVFNPCKDRYKIFDLDSLSLHP